VGLRPQRDIPARQLRASRLPTCLRYERRFITRNAFFLDQFMNESYQWAVLTLKEVEGFLAVVEAGSF